MAVILHQLNWVRFINIFLSTFGRLSSILVKMPNHALPYDTTYLQFICFCANEGFYFVKDLDNPKGRLRLTCSHCLARAADMDTCLRLLSGLLDRRIFSSAGSVRFSSHLRRTLRFVHGTGCMDVTKKKKGAAAPQPERLSLAIALDIISQLDRSGLIHADSSIMTHPKVTMIDTLCHVCLVNRAVVAVPCGHLFQCLSCWRRLITSQCDSRPPSLRDVDAMDSRALMCSEGSQGVITNIHLLGQQHCPVCRRSVRALQHIFS